MPVSKRTVSETAYGCIPREGFYRELRESQLIAESMLQKSDDSQVVTILPKCKRCVGAFYRAAEPSLWTHDFCTDCWEVESDEWHAVVHAYQYDEPVQFICIAQEVIR